MTKFAELDAYHDIGFRHEPPRDLGYEEVRVQINACGVNGLESQFFLNDQFWKAVYRGTSAAPSIGGEAVGRVRRVGWGVNHVRPGDLVIPLQERPLSGFGEEVIVPATRCVKVGPSVAYPLLAHQLGFAIHLLDDVGQVKGQKVVILGTGGVAQMLTAACSIGASEVIVIGRRDHPLTVAEGLGATRVVNIAKEAIDAVHDLLGPDGADVTFDTWGPPQGVPLALQVTRKGSAAIPGGKVAKVGYRWGVDAPRQTISEAARSGIELVECSGRDLSYLVRATETALTILASPRFDFGPVLTHHYGLDEINDAFHAMAWQPREASLIKALVVM